VITANVNLADPRLASTIETSFNSADLTTLLGIAVPQSTVKLTGRASGTIKANGTLLDEEGYFSTEGLQGTATFTELGFRAADVQLNARHRSQFVFLVAKFPSTKHSLQARDQMLS